ncbi:MAG TPA: DUF3488 and transglutaminase-like domain-containing protein, partial [Actinomycetes bacterium]|nr:DUF3488 and transglutaminase-like domain-containing protein [Actinomycetes bacterium]
ADGRDRLSRWGKLIGTDADASSGMHAVGGTGRRLGATALVAAIALPLVVPSLTDGVFGGGGTDPDAEGPGGHSSSTFKQPVVKVTPLLDLKRNLTQGADTVLMRYETSDGYGQYLRIATLDEFDGDSWVPAQISAPETQQASQGLPAPPGLSSAVVTNPVTTQIHMAGLDTPQLPLPYPVSTVSIDGDWRWDANTFDVFTPAQDGTVQELLYSAEGLRVLPTADQLETAVSSGPTLTKYLALPQETKAMLTPITDRVTEGETTAYGRALALQNWFLKNFEYSIKTVPTDSESALRSFLHDKSGYCEQFAATMGLMARVAGIPSRLQVGFTPGTKTASGTWLVSAHDAHAWPELWFEGVGWVRFEPTPSAAAGGDGIATPAWAPPPVSVDNNQPGQNGQPGDPKNRPGDPRIRRPIDRQVPTELSRGLLPGSTATSTATEEGGTAWGGYAIAAMVLVALVAITPATAARLSRRRRWAHASDGRTAALAAWHDILDLATDLDLEPLATETPRDLATRLPRQGGLTKQDTADFRDLAQAVERTRYAAPEPQTVGGDVDASDVRRWRESSSRVCRGMREAVAPRDLRRATWWPASGRAAVAVWWGQSSQRIERAWGNAMQSLRRRVGRA